MVLKSCTDKIEKKTKKQLPTETTSIFLKVSAAHSLLQLPRFVFILICIAFSKLFEFS